MTFVSVAVGAGIGYCLNGAVHFFTNKNDPDSPFGLHEGIQTTSNAIRSSLTKHRDSHASNDSSQFGSFGSGDDMTTFASRMARRASQISSDGRDGSALEINTSPSGVREHGGSFGSHRGSLFPDTNTGLQMKSPSNGNAIASGVDSQSHIGSGMDSQTRLGSHIDGLTLKPVLQKLARSKRSGSLAIESLEDLQEEGNSNPNEDQAQQEEEEGYEEGYPGKQFLRRLYIEFTNFQRLNGHHKNVMNIF